MLVTRPDGADAEASLPKVTIELANIPHLYAFGAGHYLGDEEDFDCKAFLCLRMLQAFTSFTMYAPYVPSSHICASIGR